MRVQWRLRRQAATAWVVVVALLASGASLVAGTADPAPTHAETTAAGPHADCHNHGANATLTPVGHGSHHRDGHDHAGAGDACCVLTCPAALPHPWPTTLAASPFEAPPLLREDRPDEKRHAPPVRPPRS